ncbi:MAG: hypothetical protein IKO72_00525 [Kiritimatiellae bacterium]|nr:hypothetical protein [Kiritimatiellia bacterium]
MASDSITITIGGKDGISSMLASAAKSVKGFVDGTVEGTRKAVAAFRARAAAIGQSLATESDAFVKLHKSALATYETLEQINKRIDAPKEAAKYQEELNKAIERYNRLLQESANRQKATYAKKHYYNAFDPDTAKNLDKLHGVEEAVPKSFVERLKEMSGAARKAWPALMMVNKAMGEGQGATAKFGQALTSVAGMFMAFGPAGAIIGGAQAGIDAIFDHLKKKADKMVETAQKAAAKTAEALAFTKEQQLDVYKNRTGEAAEKADKRTEDAEYEAKKQADDAAARRRREEADASVEIQRMKELAAQDKAEASESDKERIDAAWKYEIAKKEAELKAQAAEQARADEESALASAEKKLAVTEQNVEVLNAEAMRAEQKAQQIEAIFGKTDKAYVKEFQDVADAAVKRAKAEQKSAKEQKDALSIMRQDMDTNDQKRVAAEKEAAAAVEEAKSAYISAEEAREKKIREAESAYAKAAAQERMRLDVEAHERRMAQLKEEQEAETKKAEVQKSIASAAQSEFDRAFAMYRDPSRAAAEIGEEKDYRADLDRLHKDARRYGGKWRIDELSALMSRGDSQGVSDTLAQWRKSKSFTPEVEAMVRASAAEQTKTTAEDELRKIEANTAELASKLDELLKVKG